MGHKWACRSATGNHLVNELDSMRSNQSFDSRDVLARIARNFRELKDADRQSEGYNPLCGDHISLFLKLDGDRIERRTVRVDAEPE